MRFKWVSPRMDGLEFISSTAAMIAGFTDLPITEFTVNKAPIFTTLGLLDDDVFTVIPLSAMATTITHKPKIKKSIFVFMIGLSSSIFEDTLLKFESTGVGQLTSGPEGTASARHEW